ncbi:MAG TPA: UDP-N-acetylmuramate dehydrogenase [Acidimicrobiales bacterium]|nr:UDP-N-acetylmuramate dehydrogenase [Acidimicrobiales bacterium]
MEAPVDLAAARLGPRARRDEPIGARTTYRVGGNAALYVELLDEEGLAAVVGAVAESKVPLLVLGKGSNVLVADGGFDGLCVTLGGAFEELALPAAAPAGEGAAATVTAGGGLAYPVLARRLATAGLGGMSWAVGIPGSVGGAVAMNAGGHGAETADRLVAAELVHLDSGERHLAAAGDLDLAYRHSAVGAHDLVLAATFAVTAAPSGRLAEEIDEIVAWRREHQPGGRNAGSVFTNPPGDAAGRLLEEAGAKGLRVGSAVVSEKHANFIGVDSGGSADDVAALIEAACRLVAERLGVTLATEVRFVGFDR